MGSEMGERARFSVRHAPRTRTPFEHQRITQGLWELLRVSRFLMDAAKSPTSGRLAYTPPLNSDNKEPAQRSNLWQVLGQILVWLSIRASPRMSPKVLKAALLIAPANERRKLQGRAFVKHFIARSRIAHPAPRRCGQPPDGAQMALAWRGPSGWGRAAERALRRAGGHPGAGARPSRRAPAMRRRRSRERSASFGAGEFYDAPNDGWRIVGLAVGEPVVPWCEFAMTVFHTVYGYVID